MIAGNPGLDLSRTAEFDALYGKRDSSDVASALATYRGSATHAVADLLGTPLAEIECKAVEVTANLRAPTGDEVKHLESRDYTNVDYRVRLLGGVK